jgi:peroxiredoxin
MEEKYQDFQLKNKTKIFDICAKTRGRRILLKAYRIATTMGNRNQLSWQ